MIRKNLLTQFTKGEKGFTAIITTDTVDRDGEVLIPQGCNTKDWERNPVLLWMHDMQKPVGMGVGLRRKERSIEADFTFSIKPDYYEGEWFPDYARGMVESGAVRAVSVGANYHRDGVRNATQGDRAKYGEDCHRVVNRWSIHEVSLVTVPANQEALLTAISKGFITRSQAKAFASIDVPAEPMTHAAKSVIRVQVPEVGPDSVGTVLGEEIARLRGRVWM